MRILDRQAWEWPQQLGKQMLVPTYTLNELESFFSRMDPEKLFFVRSGSDLDEETLSGLISKLVASYDPSRRLENLEYLLLLFHEAGSRDQRDFLIKVFLPWTSLQRSMKNQMVRISEEFSRLGELEAYSESDTAHIATKIYRPLVADVLDPYLSLLMACYQFKEGTFIDIHHTDLGLGERSKAEFIAARIRQAGGPKDFLGGYDPLVRNALSHMGSSGIVYEPKSVLFRNIKRQTPPVVETRRWTHDQLHINVLKLLEVCMAIDAAVDIFGIDNNSILSEREMFQHVAFFALGRDTRLALKAKTDERLEVIRLSKQLTESERFELLAKLVFSECAALSIPCISMGYNIEHKVAIVSAPVTLLAKTDEEIRNQAIQLIHYAVIARAIFSTLFERYRVIGKIGGDESMTVEIPYQSLVEYSDEEAGLIDLLADATIYTPEGIVTIEINEHELSVLEDQRLGPKFPRRSTPKVDAPVPDST